MTIVWISLSLSTQKAWCIIFSVCSDKHDNLSRDFYFGTVFWTILINSNLSRPCFDSFIVLGELSRTTR